MLIQVGTTDDMKQGINRTFDNLEAALSFLQHAAELGYNTIQAGEHGYIAVCIRMKSTQ